MATTEGRTGNRKGRPNYPLEYKQRVAKAACEANISVAKLAQAHGLNPNMVFKWRRDYRAGALGMTGHEEAALLPVAMTCDSAAEGTAVSEPSWAATKPADEPVSGIEIELNGARVRVIGKVDPVQLRLVLRCLMPA